MFSIIKSKSGDVQLTLNNYPLLRKNSDPDVRNATTKGLARAMMLYEGIFTNLYLAKIKQEVLFAKSRDYNSALEAYLDKEDIPLVTYHSLIQAVGDHLEPLHRYVALRKKILGVDAVQLSDMYAPLTDTHNKYYSYDEAVSIITAALETFPTGTLICSLIRKNLTNLTQFQHTVSSLSSS
jgi:oligoendopeptidase F